jgi:hypothetical protein
VTRFQKAMQYIRKVYATRAHPIGDLEVWRKRRPKRRILRTRALQKWARGMQERARTARARRKWKNLRYEYKRKVAYLMEHKDDPKVVNVGAFQTWMLNGCPGNISPGLKLAIVRAVAHGLYITCTTNGGHTSSSWHYPWNNPDNLGHAIDAAAEGTEKEISFQRDEAARGEDLLELIGPDNSANYSRGNRYTLAEGSSLETMHDTHVHRAVSG